MFFDTVIVCSVTGSTQAGMIAGFAGQERERRVIGIDGSAKPAETHEQVARIARFTAERIGLGRDLRDDEIVLDDRWHAGTYGIPDSQTIEAMRLSASLEGMLTDPVYEGKSMAAMIDLVAGGEIEKGSNVLYAHLGRRARAERLRVAVHNGRSLIQAGTGSRSFTNPGVASTRSSQAATCSKSRGSAPASAPQCP